MDLQSSITEGCPGASSCLNPALAYKDLYKKSGIVYYTVLIRCLLGDDHGGQFRYGLVHSNYQLFGCGLLRDGSQLQVEHRWVGLFRTWFVEHGQTKCVRFLIGPGNLKHIQQVYGYITLKNKNH